MRCRELEIALVGLVRLYQIFLRPIFWVLGARCRFEPTCSVYAIEAIRKHGAWKGVRLAALRLLRCHPGHPGGFDPP